MLQLQSPSTESRSSVNQTVQVTPTMNPYFEVFSFRVTWIIGFNLFLLSIEGDNIRKDTNDSFQLLSPSTESRSSVNPTIQVTPTLNTLQ